jgi:hypothetical protein
MQITQTGDPSTQATRTIAPAAMQLADVQNTRGLVRLEHFQKASTKEEKGFCAL